VDPAVGRDGDRHDQRQGRSLTADVSNELDSLFATPPDKFIEERKRIVAALKEGGRKDDAKTVEKIPRPSVAVWTVNQIARRDPDLVGQLVAITEKLKTASGAAYGAAAAELRETLEQLRTEAAAVLAAAGHEDVGPHMIQRVIANLRAAAGDAGTRATLEQGRLVRDVEEQEMTSLFGATAADETPEAPAKKAHAKPATDGKAADAADTKAQERARAKEIAAAERDVKRRRADVAAARKNVERAESTIATARESLAVAEVRAASARAAAATAADALADAEAALARLGDGRGRA
jgi:hypothetical protein